MKKIFFAAFIMLIVTVFTACTAKQVSESTV